MTELKNILIKVNSPEPGNNLESGGIPLPGNHFLNNYLRMCERMRPMTPHVRRDKLIEGARTKKTKNRVTAAKNNRRKVRAHFVLSGDGASNIWS